MQGVSPQDDANYFSWYTFGWVFGTLKAARIHALSLIDLPGLPMQDKIQALQFTLGMKMGPWVFLRKTGYSMQKSVFWSSLLHGYGFLFLMLLDPIILNKLLSTSSTGSANYWKVALLSVSMFVRVTFMEICYFNSTRVNNNIRTGIASLMFQRILGNSEQRYDSGTLLNLMATDADKLGKTSWMVFFVAQWSFAVATLPIVIYFLHGIIGNAVWIGMVTIFVTGAISRKVGKLERPVVKKLQECRDVRSQLTKEMLGCITIIKLHVWESRWEKSAQLARENEMRQLVHLRILQALNSFVSTLCNVAIPVSIFSWYTLVQGGTLDSTVAFTTLAWITQMAWSISVLPGVYNMYAALLPSCTRLAAFFEHPIENLSSSSPFLPPGEVVADNVHLPYNLGISADFKISAGSLIMIAGPVGCGKSVLLSVLAQGISPESGSSMVGGTRAFVGQKPFLLNGSVRDNILFCREMNESKYQACIEAAALEVDLRNIAGGDGAMVGDNGIQLSGGQKARVALARALYSDADCYFLDDILSAVDATTAQFLWEVSVKGLYDRGKTIVFVTHQEQYSRKVNQVITFTSKSAQISEWKSIAASSHVLKPVVAAYEVSDDECWVTLNECESRLQQVFTGFKDQILDTGVVRRICEELRGADYDHEKKGEGLIQWQDLKIYLDAFFIQQKFLILLLLLSLLACAFLGVFMNVWLAQWSDGGGDGLAVYVGIGVAYAVAQAIQSLILTFCALRASRMIHKQMLETLLQAPMWFFDKTASGELQNKFLQDLSNIDNYVPNTLLDQISKTLNLVTHIGLVFLFAPYVVLVLPLVFLPYFLIFGTVRCAARDTRRLEAMAHSPVYTRFTDILGGRFTIKSFGVETLFQRSSNTLIESMALGKYSNEAVSKWAQTLTTQNGCLLYLACGVVAVYMSNTGKMTTGQLGLVLLYAANLQRAGMDYMMGMATLESQFVSVERVAQFLRIPNESSVAVYPRKEWHARGHLKFENVKMRYALHRPLVLRGLSFEVEAGTKVALCGRTGCGKSSTLGTIPRLYPISSGTISIDGTNISTLPLDQLRSAMRVVTQDSVLVQGTLRENIAPDASDRDIWECLEKVEMKTFVRRQSRQLDFQVEDGGKNLSVGQRQLLCTARALIGSSSLFLCDEPTANVDLKTDEKIIRVLLDLDATVLMICHRLQHIHMFDKVIVMDDGMVLEQGDPHVLLGNDASYLSKLFNVASPS